MWCHVMFGNLYSKGGALMKYEWKKHDKELYGAKKIPALIVVPEQNYIMISGKGNPNNVDFSNRVATLYSLAYAVKMGYKATAAKTNSQSDIDDYTVYPLEGIWKALQDTELVKENLEYTIMIRQPDFISEEMVRTALERVKVKKPKFIEILHIGAFDDEPASFEKMEQFAEANHLERVENYHREIYLNNANRTERNKLKTILRYSVR